MLSFIAFGFVLRRTHILPVQSGKVLSVLETTLFLPALIFTNLSTNVKSDGITDKFVTLLIGIGFLLATIVVAKLFSRFFSANREMRNVYTYIFAFSNYAYFGYPIIQSVFGPQMLARTIIFAVPFTLVIYTYGVHLLTGTKRREQVTLIAVFQSLLKPVTLAVVLGVACGLLSVKVPLVAADVLTMASNCMSPVAMILTGFVLAAFPITELFTSPTAYHATAVRLIAVPVVFAIALWLVGLRGEHYLIPVMIAAMPVGMNVVVFPEADGADSKHGARICFVSYIVSIVTIPLVFSGLSSIN